jgi:hypothetical protein
MTAVHFSESPAMRAANSCVDRGGPPGEHLNIPAGLPDAQQLVLVEKHNNGRVTMREILQVRFLQLEDTEPS